MGTVPDFPIVIEDYDGDTVAIDLTSSGCVSITTPGPGVYLGADQREAFAQAWVAACHEADRQAGVAVTSPPAATHGQVPCRAESGGYVCTAVTGHAPPDHVAHGAPGQICKRWPADRQAAAPGTTSATPDGGHARTFPVQARYAYPGNGLLFDQQTAAEHLVAGQVYTVQRMEAGGSRTLLFLLGHPETGFNSVLFAPAYDGGRQAGAMNGG